MAKNSQNFTISDLTGGLVDSEPPLAVPDDCATLAENVEFFNSTLGERRKGCVAIGLPTAITANSSIDAVTWLARHLPTNDLGDAELWALGQSLTTNTQTIQRKTASGWTTITPREDTYTVTTGYGHRFTAVSLHGKLFIALKSDQDRLHVWDGTALRRASLAASPAITTVTDTAAGGTVNAIRYYRVRYVVMSGSSVLLRGEPSDAYTYDPPGTKNGVVITKPAAINEGETHWELEASTDNANFWRIARTVVGTTTYTDSTADGVGYSSGTLSEDLTSYTTLPSGKLLTIDSDRLLIAGSWENSSYASRLWWTPTLGATGSGNDERLDMTVDPFIDLDGFDGGEITNISRAINGYIYAFKFGHIYKIIRTGQRIAAYSAIPLTKARGAFPGSLVEAVDQTGAPALYFLDPKVGPMRIGANGMEWCGKDVNTFWARVNQTATVPAHGQFYQSKNQVHFWVAVDGSSYPNAKIVVHCDRLESGKEGARKGWVTVPSGDRIAAAHCSTMFSNNIDSSEDRNQNLVPFIGMAKWTVGASTITDVIQQCDTGPTDALTTGDDDAYYYAKITTKPFPVAGVTNKFGVMNASLVAAASTGATNFVYVQAIRDFGKETVQIGVDISASNQGEAVVIKDLDNLKLSEATTIQFTFGDLDDTILPDTNWELHALGVKIRSEQTS